MSSKKNMNRFIIEKHRSSLVRIKAVKQEGRGGDHGLRSQPDLC